MNVRETYRDHLNRLCREIDDLLQREPTATGLLIHSGRRQHYHADDREIPFRPLGHFARFCPVDGPDHFLQLRRGERPQLILTVPQDYWHDTPALPDHPSLKELDVVVTPSRAETMALVAKGTGWFYIGDDRQSASALGIGADRIEPVELMAPLAWSRSFKSDYEVCQIRRAGERAARGHAQVRIGVQAGVSERELHNRYLAATDQLENETPYVNIIGWDHHAATLHYARKNNASPDPGQSLLIDAGATCDGYACDITRTYARDRAPAVFREALDRLEALQRRLIQRAAPGVEFVDLHEETHLGIAAILSELGICRLTPAEIYDRGLSLAFFPHGLGHHLGLQVHDVAGWQLDATGCERQPPQRYPHLRTTRPLEVGHVVTIEPGLYFIPALLDPLRNGSHAGAFDWKLLEDLKPCGGIRLEDDILITNTGSEDLTRDYVPGHRDEPSEARLADQSHLNYPDGTVGFQNEISVD